MKFWKHHLTTNIASSFLLLSLVAVGIVGGVTFVNARNALKEAAFERLQVAAKLKEQEISRWFDSQREDFLLICQFPDVKAKLETILQTDVSSSEYLAADEVLSNYLNEINNVRSNFQEISILNRSNQIIVSTNKSREGKYELLANVSYVEFPPIFYVSPETGKPSVTLGKILRNSKRERQGIILANLSLERIDEIVRERSGLGKSGEIYLVGSLGSSKQTFIAKGNNIENTESISSQGIDRAMAGISDADEYQNYRGVPVLGEYRWLKEQDLALLVEISQNEAFAPARKLANEIMLIGLASVGVLLIGIYWLSRQLNMYRQQSESYSQQLQAKAQEAQAANQAKSEFLANMSHELRTPLNAILGFAQLMQRDKLLSVEQRESLTTINRSGEHLLSLINDVLDMSKIEAGRTVLHPEVFNLHILLQTIQDMFQLRADAKGLFLKFTLDPKLPQYIISDEGKLRQVLINLLSNAIKFTEVGGVTVLVNQELSPPLINSHSLCLNFRVQDTGKGIAPAEINKIFDPFVQTASGVQARGGTGLGLAISRQFVRLMGGDIYPSSILGKGSTFSFYIHATLAEESIATAKNTTKKRVLHIVPSGESYRILVVDDRVENRNLLAKLLKTVGFETCTASNGLEAIEIWETWYPHLIWMDMRMVVMDGYEATTKIKAKSRQIQKPTTIIALTASAFEEEEGEIFQAGCDDLVRKPFQEDVIFAKMAQFLGVKYVYEEENKELEELKTDNPSINLVREDLDVMTSEWVTSLHQAAVTVDRDLLLQIIAQIPAQHDNLTVRLKQLVLQYDFDTIIEISG